jgi:hypothetical protein
MIEDIDFRGGNGDQIIKIGSLVAEKLGIDNININSKMIGSKNFIFSEVRD